MAIAAVANQAVDLQQRWTRWTTDRPILLDAALFGGAAILEVILDCTTRHAVALHLAGRANPGDRRRHFVHQRWPLSMLILAVADVVLQSKISAALPIAAYALAPVPPAMVRSIPAIAAATMSTVVAYTDAWGSHRGQSSRRVRAVACHSRGLRRRPVRAGGSPAGTGDRRSEQLRAQQAVFTERVRIAGEMHDVVAVGSVMVLHAGAVEMAAGDPGKVHVLAEPDRQAAAGAPASRQLVGLLGKTTTKPLPLTPRDWWRGAVLCRLGSVGLARRGDGGQCPARRHLPASWIFSI